VGCFVITVGSEPAADPPPRVRHKRCEEPGQSYAINSPAPALPQDVGTPASYVNANFGKRTFANGQPIRRLASMSVAEGFTGTSPRIVQAGKRADGLREGRAIRLAHDETNLLAQLATERSTGDLLRRRANLFPWKALETNIQLRRD
jgi:hypothetical protein